MAIELLLDIATPESAAIGIGAGVGFFLVLVAVAYGAFRLLRRSMKMVFRLAIVAAILIVAAIGSFTILWFSYAKAPAPRPPVRRQR